MRFITLVFIVSILSSVTLTKTLILGEEVKATCEFTKFQVCKPEIITGSPPSEECCEKLKEQQSCLCAYLISPSISQYIGNAKRVIRACGIPFPNCS
ncbi:unnamed protein product [Arabidopsis thaliana]|uniref:Bifunctional inhibitor/plant lipid transfer protein/seed storage helical domain-containing protein n=1 Tax=Arabidopsis thaliana TaxID=3702 RepID=A0A654EH62_ARATH|nr:unnamed protein product [Arabidopsis thaliana]